MICSKRFPSTASVCLVALVLSACAGPQHLGGAWVDSPDAVQAPYPDGVPHTDPQGRPRHDFSPDESFFPIGLYHAVTGTFGGVTYSFDVAVEAGHNTVVAWGGLDTTRVLEAADAAGVQVIMSLPKDQTVRAAHDHPRVLGFDIDHEPSIARKPADVGKRLERFRARRAQIRAIDPDRAVFTVDYPAVRSDRIDGWNDWKRAGDVASFWNYPVAGGRASSVDGYAGIGRTVSLAVQAVAARKPVWFIAQAFESPIQKFDWRMPDEREARAMAYAALVHGATGLIWFSYDSFVTRNGLVIGISPDPQTKYAFVTPASLTGENYFAADDRQIAKSRALWNAVSRLNRELAAQTDIWLSPTADMDYRVEIRGARTSRDPMRTQLKRTKDGLLLAGVNVDDTPVDFRVSMPRGIAAFERVAGDAQAAVTNGRLAGTLAGFGTFVFRLVLEPEPVPNRDER